MEWFYASLFQTAGDSEAIQAARKELLQHTTSRVTIAQREEIKRVPTVEEIRKILLSLPKEKAQGLDGLTVEVLLASWSFIQADYVAMIKHFWEIDILSHSTTSGVMKLIPKKVDKSRLKDWRPLTMLPIVYKLIAKPAYKMPQPS